MGIDEKKALLQNEKSKIVILYNPFDRKLVSLFSQIPWEYGGMGGVVGKKYEAIKDYLAWNGLPVKEFTPLFVKMGEVWASTESTGQKG